MEGVFVLPRPYLDRGVFTSELFEREFAEIADSLAIEIVRALFNRLMVGSLVVDLVGRIPIHHFYR